MTQTPPRLSRSHRTKLKEKACNSKKALLALTLINPVSLTDREKRESLPYRIKYTRELSILLFHHPHTRFLSPLSSPSLFYFLPDHSTLSERLGFLKSALRACILLVFFQKYKSSSRSFVWV